MSNLKQKATNIYRALRDRPNLAPAYYGIKYAIFGVIAVTISGVMAEFVFSSDIFSADAFGFLKSVGHENSSAATLLVLASYVGVIILGALCVGFADMLLWRWTGLRLRDVADELSANPIDYIRRVRFFGNIEGAEDLTGAGYPLKTKKEMLEEVAWMNFCDFIREHSYKGPNAKAWALTLPNPKMTNQEMLSDIFNRAREVYFDLIEFGEVDEAMDALAFNYNRSPMLVEISTQDDCAAFRTRVETLLNKLRVALDPALATDELVWCVERDRGVVWSDDIRWVALSLTERHKLAKRVA